MGKVTDWELWCRIKQLSQESRKAVLELINVLLSLERKE